MPPHVAVKESVFPFAKFPGVDTLLGPEMRSTGEVMGIAQQLRGGLRQGHGRERARACPSRAWCSSACATTTSSLLARFARNLVELGFTIIATEGTAQALARTGVKAQVVNKFYEAQPNIVDFLRDGKICMVINTTEGEKAIRDSYTLRRQTLVSSVPYFTTVAAATAAVAAIEASLAGPAGSALAAGVPRGNPARATPSVFPSA